ncbi:hypothetical protein FLM48_19360 [Shewanella sp. Scap07]|uniref:hypothetical protein n=1 Tax=Shewanella sp. Scap07 TaxID=2589987 RepID=UPI0015C1C479|nr:hypothetical protein [Shewanella sp. Scap07]QLE87039.1 hypothetical protein FLM48_19360 [Shewanella sp. Scap07]
MLCTHCSQSFRVDTVNAQRGKGLSAEVQCPHCFAWLGKSVALSYIKIAGFYIGAIALLIGYFYAEWRTVTTPVAILSTMMLLVSHMMDHLKVIEAPEQDDTQDEEHRQKYR